MAEFKPTHPLDTFFSRLDNQTGKENISVAVVSNHTMANIFSIDGKLTTVEKALGIKQSPGKASVTKDYRAIPLSPRQWLVVSAKPDTKGFANGIRTKLKKNGYVSEQSDARVIFRISGEKARELMQKACRLDLHPSVTSKNWCAQTVMAQTGVIIHQLDEAPTYDLFVYAGFAQDFADWLLHTGLQLGIGFNKA